MKKHLLLIHIFFIHTISFTQPLNQRSIASGDSIAHQYKCTPALQARLQSQLTDKHFFTLTIADTVAFTHFTQQHSKALEVKGIWREAQVYLIYMSDLFFQQQVLPLPYLRFADSRTTQPVDELAIGNFNQAFNSINMVKAVYPQLTGEGLTVSVKENRFDTSDIDFRQRILNTGIAGKTASSHASTMATLIGGAGNTYYTSAGVVKGVTLSSASYEVLLPDTAAYAQYNISVQNHSYGVGIENYYGADAAAYDISMLRDTVLLHVFSSGNAGSSAASSGRYQGLTGFANITGSFKMAKNVLTTGSLDASFGVPALSSRGPAYDGRIKPELVAYGEDGSSGAAALTSGTALLLQHAWRLQQAGTLPASTLLKAVLINSATDILQPGPDYLSGFGSLNAWKAVNTLLRRQYLYGNVAQNGSSSFAVTVPEQAANLKITLAWNDTAATPNAPVALVNDLDLELYHPASGNSWQPWILYPAAKADSLLLPAHRGRDSLNVTEQITLSTPLPGEYLLRVKGHQVNNRQSFYIAYQWDTLQQFYWTSPVHTDHFLPGEDNIFKWEYSGPATSGTLAVSYDKGIHWQTIDNAVPLHAPYYRWAAPDTFTAAIARMEINDRAFTSESFTICNQPYPAVGFSCTDSLLLYWRRLPGAAAYRLYQLQGKYLQPTESPVNDTSIILYHPVTTSNYYAVQPIAGDGTAGNISYAVDYLLQGAACYFSSLQADLQTDNTGRINVQLGSLYNINSIDIEKRTGAGWVKLRTYPVTTAMQYTLTDSNLINGPNTYRCALNTITGGVIQSDAASLYYWGNEDFILYPNPVTGNVPLQLLSKNPFNKTATLYHNSGKKIWQLPVNNSLEQFSVAGLPSGTYLLVIHEQAKKLAVKKLVIQ